MTLVEGVSSERQHVETITTVQKSSAPKLMLPSDFFQTTGSSSSPAFSAKVPASSVPTVAVNPPTPRTEVGTEKELYGVPSSQAPSLHTGSNEVRHNPPPRTASPLRSALRRRSPSPSSGAIPESGASPLSASASVAAPVPVHSSPPIFAPIPVRPRPLTRESEEDISSYETGHEDLSGEDNEDDEPDVPTPTTDKNPVQTRQATHVPNGVGGATNQSPPSTDLSGETADATLVPDSSNVVRRKSVRLDVPATPSPGAHSTAPHLTFNKDRRLPRIPDSPSNVKANGEARGGGWKTRISETEGPVPDAWADSSEEDADYARARKLLEKAKKKEKAVKADAAALTARTSTSKKRHSVR